MEAFNVYILLITLSNYNQYVKSILKNTTEEDLVNALEFFQYHTSSIEVLFKGKLARIYFPVQPICRYLPENTKIDFLTNVCRDSPNEKIIGFLKKLISFLLLDCFIYLLIIIFLN